MPENSVGIDAAIGSIWHRWDPHIHAPGTILNDQYGPDAWDAFLDKIESSNPIIRAIGVTDYYSIECYERMLASKAAGRIPNCGLIFPNIEMRLGIGTIRGSFVNVHLLVSPDGDNHIDEIKRILSRLTFDAYSDSFSCSKEELTRLGYRFDSSIKDDRLALKRGAEQFKVSTQQLKKIFDDIQWARDNIVIGIAGGSNDGTSGIRDSADAVMRQEIEKMADVIFSSNPGQREFWLGEKDLSPDEIKERYGSLKPCLHGSDAHKLEKVAAPDLDRYSWIKGAISFDSLLQAAIEPKGRAFVGTNAPVSATPSQIISRVRVSEAPWLSTPEIRLNPGLVAIIGARGSGKTALADMIAAGCDAITSPVNSQSFLSRAETLIRNVLLSLDWQAGESDDHVLDGSYINYGDRYPRARYLSQQFVDTLCSADGMTDDLLREIERVIFESHDYESREGSVDFEEILAAKTAKYRDARTREERSLSNLSDLIGAELEKERLVVPLRAQVLEKSQSIERYTLDRNKLVGVGSDERLARLTALSEFAEKRRAEVRALRTQQLAVEELESEVRDFQQNQSPERLRELRYRFQTLQLSDNDWDNFLLQYREEVNPIIEASATSIRVMIDKLTGTQIGALQDPQQPIIRSDEDLASISLLKLEAEIERLQGLVTLDREATRKFTELSKKIFEEATLRDRAAERLKDCEGAKSRRIQLVSEREDGYKRVFDIVLAEQRVLSELYAPLMERLSKSDTAAKKLSFSVRRQADVESWSTEGETLLDLRKQGPFKGHGTLLKLANEALKSEWETGDSASIFAAMANFRAAHEADFLLHAPVSRDQSSDYRTWTKNFAQWLYSTTHLRVHYSVDYDGVDIRKLSPGTRGIVLLLLYLALDESDDRPLIIDQPEENLDPKSIFDELVKLFLEVKSRRQVIIVTHNANLVVNTDADQIIVATVGTQSAGCLPTIGYISGGLEDRTIRKLVCEILEGGESAFKERARRLRVKLAY